jgi:hypothetical protein
MKKILIILITLMSSFLFIGCQSIQKTFVPSKNSGSDEFLVKKKSPLVMPPNYNELPKPIQDQNQNNNNSQEIDIRSLIKNKSPEIKKQNDGTNSVSSLESLILKKIRDE